MKGLGIAQRLAAIAGCIFLVTAPLGDARSENPGGGSALQQLAEQARIAEVLSSLNDRPMPEISILRNVRVVDPVEGAVTPPQSIVVSNGAIFWIGDRGSEPSFEGAAIIEGDGRYAAPGLTDMHVHSESASSWLLNLANGVTTVREMGGLPWLLASREAIAADRIAGPNLYVAGTIINYVPLGGYAAVVKDAVTARRVVRQQVACGYDLIKIHNVLPGPLLDAVADEAARQGIDLVGHVPHGVPVRHAVERGMRTLEHFKGFLDDRTLEIGDTDYAAANNAELWVTPTLYAFRYFERDDVPSLLRSPPARYVPQRTRRSWVSGLPKQGSASDTLAESLPGRMRQIVQSLLAHDAQFLAGTDAANYPFQVMGFALLDEMRLLAEAGVPWSEVLRSATSSPAAAMRTKQFGRLRPGTRADIVLLDRNPLADRTAYERNQGVMVRGRWLDRALLDRALAQLADLFEQPPLSDQPDRQQITALVGKVAEKTAEGFVFNSRTVLAAADQVRRSGDAAAADRLAGQAIDPKVGPCGGIAQ